MSDIAPGTTPKIAKTPQQGAPKGTVDTHIHMLAAQREFALATTRVENPPADLDMDGFIARYKAQMETLGVDRTVVIHSIMYGGDNSVTIEAIRRLGPNTKGIGLLADGATEAELDAFADAGIKGLRVNYIYEGILTWAGAKAMIPMLKERGMHLQLLLNSDKHMASLAADIRACDVPVVVDHIGWPTDITAGPSEPGFQTLCALMSEGHAYTKLSGLYRLDTAPFPKTDPHVAALIEANPERCLWASDWPYIMLGDAQMSDAGTLFDAFDRVVPSAHRERILVGNPVSLYGFDPL